MGAAARDARAADSSTASVTGESICMNRQHATAGRITVLSDGSYRQILVASRDGIEVVAIVVDWVEGCRWVQYGDPHMVQLSSLSLVE